MGQNLVEVFDGIYAFRNNAPKNTNGLILIHPFYEDHEYNPKYLGHLENLLKRVKIPVFTLTDGDIEEEAGRIAEMSNKKWKYFLKTVSGDPEPEIGWYNFQTLVKGAGINTVSLAGGNYNPPGKKNVPESGCLADAKDKLKMFNLDVLIRQDAIYSNVMPE